MQVAVETTDGLERIMTVTFPVADMAKDIQKRLREIARTARLNGFRPGKIPPHVVQQRFGAQVKAEVINEQIQRTFQQAITEEKLHPAGMPEIHDVDDSQKDSVTYKAKFEVYPDFEIASFSGKSFELPVVEITDADVDSTIENIRQQQQHFHETDAAAEDGYRLTVSFTGTIDGEPFEGNEGKDIQVVIGSGKMIEGFESGLIGASKGETRTLELTFPENYHAATVAGKPVTFEITIDKVEEPHLPELDEEFFKLYGVHEGGLDTFKAEVKKNMQMELDKAITAAKKNQVMEALLELNPIDVPKALVEDEARNMAEQMKQQYQIQGDALQNDLSLFEEEAKKRVSLGLILSETVKSKEISVSEDEIRERVTQLAQSYENPQEVINYYMNDKNRKFEIESLLMEEKVVDLAFDEAQVTEKNYGFVEFMRPEEKK